MRFWSCRLEGAAAEFERTLGGVSRSQAPNAHRLPTGAHGLVARLGPAGQPDAKALYAAAVLAYASVRCRDGA